VEDAIKTLEERVRIDRLARQNSTESDFDKFCESECLAIEKLIKGYRELEERNKYWNDRIEYAKKETEGLKMYEMGMAWEDMKKDLENSIPKSKIEEIIKELDSMINEISKGNLQRYTIGEIICFKKILQELTEE